MCKKEGTKKPLDLLCSFFWFSASYLFIVFLSQYLIIKNGFEDKPVEIFVNSALAITACLVIPFHFKIRKFSKKTSVFFMIGIFLWSIIKSSDRLSFNLTSGYQCILCIPSIYFIVILIKIIRLDSIDKWLTNILITLCVTLIVAVISSAILCFIWPIYVYFFLFLVPFLTIAVLGKIWGIIAGIVWIWKNGESNYFWTRLKLLKLEKQLKKCGSDKRLEHKLEFKIKNYIYNTFKNSPNLGILDGPFGVMDNCWRNKINTLKKLTKIKIHPKMKQPYFQHWLYKNLREYFFRYESLAIISAISLFLAPYANNYPAGDFSFINVAVPLLAILLLISSFLMGLEILIGITLMKENYTKYFHLQVADRTYLNMSAEKRLLDQIWRFTKLSFHTLISISAACFVFHACFHCFHSVQIFDTHSYSFSTTFSNDSFPLVTYSELPPELSERFYWFIKFFYFSITTFTTIGYGDITPTTTIGRILVIAIHIISFSYILFLLQVLFAYFTTPNGNEL